MELINLIQSFIFIQYTFVEALLWARLGTVSGTRNTTVDKIKLLLWRAVV